MLPFLAISLMHFLVKVFFPDWGLHKALVAFAHSFYAEASDSRANIAYTDYGFDMPASVQKMNIYGTQFHPEKSGEAGLKILQNFYDICKRKAREC